MRSMTHHDRAYNVVSVLRRHSLVRPLILICLIVLFGIILPMWSGPTPNASAWFANNLFQNADFETGSMTPWTQSAGPAGNVFVTTGDNHTPGGTYNVRLNGVGQTVELKQRVNGLTAGPIYYLGAFVRQTNSTGDPLGFGATSYGYTNCGGFNYVNPPKWELLSCQGVIPPGYNYLAPKMSYNSTSPYYAATDDWYLAQTPLTTTSIYVGSVDYNTLYGLGSTAGMSLPQGNIVVLDYGYPSNQSGVQGARIWAPNGARPFQSTAAIQNAVQGYLDGFWAGTGQSSAFLTVAVGVNNAAYQGTNGVTLDHANAWAGMANNLRNYINAHGYSSKIAVAGAMDIEQDSAQGYQNATITRVWVDAWGRATTLFYYDFGSCSGCPTTLDPVSHVPAGWTVDDIFYVAYGASPAYAVPEIYAQSGVNADQWYTLALNHSPVILFSGTLTQWMACNQREIKYGYHCYISNPPVDGTQNFPGMGWGQLSQYLNFNFITNESGIRSTDIMWQYP